MIEMNRVTRLLHKMHFLSRQRRAVNFSHKFVISDKDLAREERAKDDTIDPDPAAVTARLHEGFDPESSEKDRLILYEVTGLRLFLNEFLDEDSSDSDKGDPPDWIDPD